MPSLKLSGYRTLFDRPEYPSSYAMAVNLNGRLVMSLIRASDGAKGLRGWLVTSDDMGKTWSTPQDFGPPIEDPSSSNQTVHVAGVTPDGRLLAVGYLIPQGIDETGN